MDDLDTLIKNKIGDCKSVISDKKCETPEFEVEDLLGQISFCFDLHKFKINQRYEPHYGDDSRPEYNEVPNMDVESEAFDKFFGKSC